MADLHLNLKGIYFEQIRDGTKLFEDRSKFIWWKRLEDRQFDRVFIKCGYPRGGDVDKIIERPWRGFEVQMITHPHFGPDTIEVCSIRVD
ncbi:ASCH domain-containing protein [Janthinobacterium sp. NKUCC06_STL]|uniref:ASCH domain-containing protein n=1 Tax=Janthinobacterium sp. NKUCC06_STL TaxID=2842127 RepID=UPI001C5B1056|nr:ASCH domain-containing protein [Janthinobacterium sp. NKUCC06_STL]MBW3512230.1 ASCH domain-containing protein [Janthinobacterium sp. NKUCC06_STL]